MLGRGKPSFLQRRESVGAHSPMMVGGHSSIHKRGKPSFLIKRESVEGHSPMMGGGHTPVLGRGKPSFLQRRDSIFAGHDPIPRDSVNAGGGGISPVALKRRMSHRRESFSKTSVLGRRDSVNPLSRAKTLINHGHGNANV